MEKQNITKKVCIECSYFIPIDARKCVNCNSFQDWRRHFKVSAVVLSLIVAILTSTALMFLVMDKLIKPDSNIRVSVYPSKKLSYCLISNNIFSSQDTFPDSSIPVLESFRSHSPKFDTTNNQITLKEFLIDSSIVLCGKNIHFFN